MPADCCTSPGIDPPKAPEVQLRDSAQRHREVQARRAPDALRGCAEEGAGDAHVVVVGRADVHHQVGGRAQPVPAAEGVASPRRQRVGARRRRSGSWRSPPAGSLPPRSWPRPGALAVGAHQKISKRGERGLQQHLAQGGQRDVVGPSVEELVLQQQRRSRRVLLHRVAGLQGCVQDLEAVNVHRSCKCAPKCSFATPLGGAVKYILAVLQAPWSPTKLPYNGS